MNGCGCDWETAVGEGIKASGRVGGGEWETESGRGTA
jgi:hypothetical protein